MAVYTGCARWLTHRIKNRVFDSARGVRFTEVYKSLHSDI
jgi:hypothetical protein